MSNRTRTDCKRRYRKRRRAELEDQTRLRITEAAVDLHGSVGPAKTTISAIADRAGVQRATVYRHFPDEAALFDACSSHWAAQHPLPDLEAWAAIEDPGERLTTALAELYAWYADAEYMLDKTTRDAPRGAGDASPGGAPCRPGSRQRSRPSRQGPRRARRPPPPRAGRDRARDLVRRLALPRPAAGPLGARGGEPDGRAGRRGGGLRLTSKRRLTRGPSRNRPRPWRCCRRRR